MAEKVNIKNEIDILKMEETRLNDMFQERVQDLQALRQTLLRLKEEKQKWLPEKLSKIKKIHSREKSNQNYSENSRWK